MQTVRNHGFWRSSIRAVPGIVLVGLVTFICYGLGVNLTVTAFLYLIVVVLQSLLGDFISSAAVSIVADLSLNFFFVPPIFSLRVSDSSDAWALITFLVTGLVVTRLTTRLRRQAEISELHRRQMKLLYECGDIIRVILNTAPQDADVAGPSQFRYRKALVRIGRQLANLGALRKSMDPNQAVDVLWFYFGYSGLCPPLRPLA